MIRLHTQKEYEGWNYWWKSRRFAEINKKFQLMHLNFTFVRMNINDTNIKSETVTEVRGFWGLSTWTLHVLPVFTWVLSGGSSHPETCRWEWLNSPHWRRDWLSIFSPAINWQHVKMCLVEINMNESWNYINTQELKLKVSDTKWTK